MTLSSLPLAAATIALTLGLGACANIEPARMALPEGLAARSEAVDLPKLTTGRQGSADVLGRHLQFERSATRLALFNEFSVAERSALRYSLGDGSNDASTANCAVRRRTMAIGIVEWTAKPLALFCDFSPTGARLVLDEQRAGLATLKVARQGRLTVGGRTLTVRSVHQAQGALLELAQPIGYVIEDAGRALAAVETNGRAPRLYLPVDDAALRQATLQALLALALIWDVANG